MPRNFYMSVDDLKTLINTLQLLGVRRYKDVIAGLELDLDPIRPGATDLFGDSVEPETKRESLLSQMAALKQQEDDLESWST